MTMRQAFRRTEWLGNRKPSSRRKSQRRRVLRCEQLEDRQLLAADLAAIADTTLLLGSPLHIGLDGENGNGDGLTYTVSTNNPNVQATIFQDNPSMRLSVAGFGDMVFQLFEDRAERPVDRIIQLVNSGYYTNVLFHRVLDNFVIQAGNATISGTSPSGLGTYDDQFHVDLQHNTTGLLSSAKLDDQGINGSSLPNGDDTNTTEFFVTEGASRHLDFNHSVFGMLTEGESVREAISEVPVNASGRPNTDVVISSAEIFQDNENAVLMLKALNGATGTVTVTVTATDPQGNFVQRQFDVTIAADTVDSNPFLNDIPTIHTTANSTVNVNVGFQDADGGAHTFLDEVSLAGVNVIHTNPNTGQAFIAPAGVPAPSDANITYSINPNTGALTVNTGGATGVFEITVAVATVQASANLGGTVVSNFANGVDYQVVQVVVAEAAPSGVDLLASSDSAVDTDNITNDNTLEFTVSGVVDGATVTLYAGDTILDQVVASGTTATFNTDVSLLPDGVYSITATQTTNDAESQKSGVLTLTLDRSVSQFASVAPNAQPNVAYNYTAANPNDLTTVTYQLQNAPSGMSINANTGVITWTPTLVQIGAQTFNVVATDTAGNMRTLNASIVVSQTPPTSIDLKTESDSGSNKTNNITNDTTPTFTVDGVVPGATVKVYARNASGTTALLGEAVADSTSVDVTGSNPTFLVNGTYKVLATQTLDGAKSATFQAGFDLVMDITGPVFTSTPRAQTLAGLSFSYNAQTDEETAANPVTYALVGAPAGMTINATSGVVSWSPSTAVVGVHSFQVTATDAQSNVTSQNVNLEVVYEPLAELTVRFTTLDGNTVLDQVNVGDQFLLQVLVQDTRSILPNTALPNNGAGVATAIVDLFFNNSLVQGALGSISNHGDYNFLPQGTVTATQITSAGGSQTSLLSGPLGSGVFTVFSVPFTAIAVPPFGAVNDTLNVNENTSSNALDVLFNDGVGLAQFTINPDSTQVGLFDPAITLPAPGTNPSPLVNIVNGTLRIAGDSSPTVVHVGTAAHGNVSIGANGTNLLYTPTPGYVGTDSFTYTIDDGNGGIAQATVTVNVNDVNDPPTVADDSFTAVEDSVDNIFDVLANDSIAPDTGETLTLSNVGGANHGGTVVIDNGMVRYTPAEDFFGNETFTYTVTDSRGGSDTAMVTVSVSGVIDPPAASADVFQVSDNSSNNTLNVLANDTIAPDTGETLTVSGVGTAAHGTVSISGDSLSLIYTPATDYVGTDSFSYTITDSNGQSAAAIVTVHVGNVNVPIAVDDSFSAQEDSSNNEYNPLANDLLGANQSPITITSVGAGNKGGTLTRTSNNTRVLYTPKANFFGTETFTYTVKDAFGESSTATMTVNVAGVNDAPIATNDIFNLNEDSVATVLSVLSNDTIAPDTGEVLTITAVGAGNKGGSIHIEDGGTGIVYTPAANFFGQETFTYTISDGNGKTATATVQVNVQSVNNDPPTATNDTFTTSKNTSANFINVLQNDSVAPDTGETLTVASVGSGSQSGTITVATNGTGVLYTPAANFVGTETFTYTLRDSSGDTSTATVTVTVRDFIPSDISGFVYRDIFANGVRDFGEYGIAQIRINLTGIDDFGTSVSRTTLTDATGRYIFEDLAPGNYTVQQIQPKFLVDRAETAGQFSTIVGNDRFFIDLPENVVSSNNNFGEGTLDPQYAPRNLFYASTPRGSVVVAVDTQGGSSWYVDMSATSSSQPFQANVSPDGKNLEVRLGDTSTTHQFGSFPIDVGGFVSKFAEVGPNRLYTFTAPLSLLPFVTTSGIPDGEAEGEPSNLAQTQAVDAVFTSENGDGEAEGEPTPESVDAVLEDELALVL